MKQNWKADSQELILEKQKVSGCVFIFLSFFGIVMMSGGIAGIYFRYSSTDSDNFFLLFIFYFLTMMGLIITYAGFTSPSKGFGEKIVFSLSREKIFFYLSSLQNIPFEIGLGEILHIHVLKERRRSSSSTSGHSSYYTVYLVYLIKTDGAEICLTLFNLEDEWLRFIDALVQFTGLPLKSETEAVQEKNGSKTYHPLENSSLSYPLSGFVKEENSEGKRIFTIKKEKKNLFSKMMASLIWLFLVSLPVFILIHVFLLMTDTDISSIVIKVLTGIFSLFFLTLLFLTLLNSFKTYSIAVSSKGVDISLKFPVFSFFNQEVSIPASDIRQVRVNRGEEGHFFLSLGIADSVNLTLKKRIFFTMGAFQKKDIAGKFLSSIKMLPLWEVQAWAKPGLTATVFDLLYLEKMIEKGLRLSEKAIL
ncbi:MAG: hypothetical protein A2Y41_06210 [Spirochaetes bacterium GWB1_36_13]|nr:MAG: hypothetical protein A2Y41_06210 [Spirochaetes bacterium GWB1_36_13]